MQESSRPRKERSARISERGHYGKLSKFQGFKDLGPGSQDLAATTLKLKSPDVETRQVSSFKVSKFWDPSSKSWQPSL